MYCNKPVVGVSVIGLLGLALIFMFDPTHNYPTIQAEIDLTPGNATVIAVPTAMSGFMEWAGSIIGDPHLWIEIDVDGVELVDYKQVLSPGVQFGFPASYNVSKGELLVINLLNETISAIFTCVLAPTPGALGDAKAWWYVVFGILELIVTVALAIINPTGAATSNTVTRVPSTNSIAAAATATTSKASAASTGCIMSFIIGILQKIFGGPPQTTNAAASAKRSSSIALHSV